jgi:hypothetical protein
MLKLCGHSPLFSSIEFCFVSSQCCLYCCHYLLLQRELPQAISVGEEFRIPPPINRGVQLSTRLIRAQEPVERFQKACLLQLMRRACRKRIRDLMEQFDRV